MKRRKRKAAITPDSYPEWTFAYSKAVEPDAFAHSELGLMIVEVECCVITATRKDVRFRACDSDANRAWAEIVRLIGYQE